MRTRIITATLLVASTGSMGLAASAQTPASNPAWIQSGACDAPGVSVATLTALTGSAVGVEPSASPLPQGLGTAVPVSSSATTIQIPLADLLAAGHSLAVGRTAADPTIVACGDIGGQAAADLAIGLAAVDGSGSTGVATFHDGGAGTTVVSVYLLGSGEAAASSPSPTAPTATTVTLGQSLYYAGLDILVKDATYDPVAGTLTLDVTYHNTGTAETHLEALSGGRVWVGWDQTVINMPAPSGTVPAGMTVPGTISGSVPAGFSLDDAVLTFGLPGDHQATLPLVAGSAATSEQPVVMELNKKVRAKKYATFQVTGAQVVPALCSGSFDRFVFTPAPIDVASIVVTLNVSGGTAIGGGGLGLGGSFAKGPDGLSGAGTLGTPVLGPHQVFRAVNYCFPVTSPVHGKHTITFLTDPAKASMTLDVP